MHAMKCLMGMFKNYNNLLEILDNQLTIGYQISKLYTFHCCIGSPFEYLLPFNRVTINAFDC